MTRWRKVRAVASWEFLCAVKRMGYLITTFGMPVFVLLYGGVLSVIGIFIHGKENEIKIYGVVDHAEVLQLEGETSRPAVEIPDEIRSALQRLPDTPTVGRALAWWENFVFRPYEDLDDARAALLASDIQGVYVLPEDYLATGRVESYAGEGPDFEGSESRSALKNLLLDRLLEGKVAEDVAERVRKPIASHKDWTLTSDGEVQERSVVAVLAKLLVPIVFTVLLFMSLMMSAGYLLQGTATEKENKLAEVILSSANPEEIMTGKLLGLGGAGLLQICVWFGMVVVAGFVFAGALQVAGFDTPWRAMVTGLFFFLVGYLFMGSLMLGTGALGSNMRESQQLSMVWTLSSIAPMVFMQILIFEPNGTLGRVLVWIPFTAPVTMVLRTALEPEGVPWWETVGSFLVLVCATWLAVGFGARLFRVGLLLTGARPKLREILRQARLSTR